MKTFTIIFSLLLTISLFSQVKKEVENGVWVTFPDTPVYNVAQGMRQYATATEEVLFLVQITEIPNRVEYLTMERNLSESEKKQLSDRLLNGFVQGVMANSGNEAQVQPIKKGNFYGRKMSYSAINPATGEVGKRSVVVLDVRGKIVAFMCMQLNDSQEAHSEVNTFLNSIAVK